MFRQIILKRCIAILLLSSLYVSAETISYDYDDMDIIESSNSPVPANVSGMRQRILEQDERIDGLISMIEGLSASLHELRSNGVEDEITSSDTSRDANGEILQKLANMIDEINDSYVTKKEVKAMLLKSNLTQVEEKSISSNRDKESTSTELKNKSNASLYNEGVRNFFKKRYSQAKERFVITDKKGHKPAASNYYLGEIAYYTENPKDAIFHFKKSAQLYGDASYMDTLLLHTAISLAKTGETGQARAFFENIIASYPDKKTAKIAKDRLKKL